MKFAKPIPLQELMKDFSIKAIIGNENIEAEGINEIHKVEQGDITFVDSEKYYKKAFSSKASIILIDKEIEETLNDKTLIVCMNPFKIYNQLMKRYRPFRPFHRMIDESSFIHPSAIIEPNVIIGAHVTIGKNTYIQSNVVIRDYCKIGNHVSIQSGTILAADAFYYQKQEGQLKKWHSGGKLLIEDYVEIGAACTICKGVSGDTVIGAGTKIDAQVHIGHGVVLGKNCLLAAQVGIGGKTIIGDEVTLYGQVGIAPRLTIGNKAIVLAKSGVSKNLEGGKTYFGYPATEAISRYKELAALRMLPNLIKK